MKSLKYLIKNIHAYLYYASIKIIDDLILK